MTYKFKNSYIKNCYTIAGMYEKDGPIGKYFDKTYDNNLYFKKDTWEKADRKSVV